MVKFFVGTFLASAILWGQVRPEDQVAVAQAKAHFQANAGAYGLGADNQLKEKKSRRDPQGVTHIRFSQYFRNVSVFEGDAIAHVGPGGEVTVTDSIQKGLTIGVSPRVGRGVALNIASTGLGLRGKPDVESGDLQVLARGERSAVERLVWHFKIAVENDVDEPGHWDIFVDAVTGAVVWSFDSLETTAAVGAGLTMFSGNVNLDTNFTGTTYTLLDTTRANNRTVDMRNKQGGSGVLVDDPANQFGNNIADSSDPDTAAADAHFGMMKTWDYYKNTFGRNGIDGAGKSTYSRVHFGRNYQNAYWSNSCFCMTYGDGGSTFLPLVSLDVAGHEMTHGVTERESGLTYSGESGGLNEATSDIFGTLVEYYAGNAQDTGDYWIGERIYRANWSGGIFTQNKALRYMDDPAKDGRSPACWSSNLGTLDVHYSSGPANHMFYLLANGGTSKCNGNNVSSIGRPKAGAIWYKALTDYMTSSTNYHGGRTAALNAATALYGAGSPEYNAVAAAFSAINVQ
ncbi:MAG: M4 family metallopeptidase [Acidobacteria bacterium]|nr:M4 family metallopeptidase [Acidobacteriota bacterium]